jgi:quinol-cytochrome oxidoreductase complex cytochrome b subunit
MPSLSDIVYESQIWKSVFRHPMPADRRNRIVVMLTNFFLHLHPVSIKKQGIALSFTWCMGGVTFFLFLVETVTGVLLMFYYRPTLEWAYHDILALRDVTSFGILRELHRWGAHAMVITVWLHMYRVFLTGSYKPPREFNWVIGVVLLLLTIDGIEMITNASDARFGLLGARFVGEETLNRFYVLHCVAIPLAASLLLAIHFWRVRKDGGISGPL